MLCFLFSYLYALVGYTVVHLVPLKLSLSQVQKLRVSLVSLLVELFLEGARFLGCDERLARVLLVWTSFESGKLIHTVDVFGTFTLSHVRNMDVVIEVLLYNIKVDLLAHLDALTFTTDELIKVLCVFIVLINLAFKFRHLFVLVVLSHLCEVFVCKQLASLLKSLISTQFVLLEIIDLLIYIALVDAHLKLLKLAINFVIVHLTTMLICRIHILFPLLLLLHLMIKLCLFTPTILDLLPKVIDFAIDMGGRVHARNGHRAFRG